MSRRDTLVSYVLKITVIDSIPVIQPVRKVFLEEQAEEMERVVLELRKRGHPDLIVDLSSCDYISSEGLGAVTAAWEWCSERNSGRMAVILGDTADAEVINLFEITGVSRTIGGAIHATITDAVRYIKQFCDPPSIPSVNPQ
jgi:anti-anti-sigma factor